MMIYCRTCFLPSTKPDLYFDENGVCSACLAFNERSKIDWDQRALEFRDIIEKMRSKSESKWDCVIPVSGGKDSTAQVIKILELGLKPLCVTATTCDLTELGRKNIENIKNLGVDHIEFSPNPRVRAMLNKIGLQQIGDISWPEHVGIFTIPVRIAVQYGISLIIWGENSQNEYGGPVSAAQNNILGRSWLEEFGGLLGLRVTDLADSYGIHESDLAPYVYPTNDELQKIGVTGLFLGYYFQWDGYSNYVLSKAHGFSSYKATIEGSIVDYENLDNYQTGIHDYFKFLKYGFGRATDLVSVNLRRGKVTRSEGLDMIKKHDGMYPSTYLGKPLADILKRIGINLVEFDEICERFTNRQLFITDDKNNLVRDSSKNLIKVNYDNL
jgi:N-acetyl sugar amidotransferase